MNPIGIILGILFSGIAAAFVWVAFWTVTVPQIWEGQVWAGHAGLILPVFVLGCVASPVVALLLKR